MSETIGVRLRRLRLERGLTQRELAVPGVTAQYISRVEHGQRNPSVKALRKLAAKLDVAAEFLETGLDAAGNDVRAFRLADAELALRLDADPANLEETFQSLFDHATAASDEHATIRAALGLGSLAARRGDHERSIELLEVAVSAPWVTVRRHADVYATLGHSLVAVGREGDAIALFRSCLEELTAPPLLHDAVTRFATYLSFALVDAGAISEAREATELALRHGQASDDPYTRIRLHWASARLAASAGELEVAELSITKAIALLEATEDTTALARAHLVAAEISLLERDHLAAGEHLATAEAVLPDGSALEDQAFLRIQQAFLAARIGATAEALDRANSAVRLVANLADATIRGRAQWALAEAYAGAGADESARAAFSAASELIRPGSKYAARLIEAWQLAVPQ